MKILTDTNVFLGVALDEPEKPWLQEMTAGADLVAPAVLPYEIANALSGLVRRKRLTVESAGEVWQVVQRIPVELVDVDLQSALLLAAKCEIYAYDACFLQCALQLRCPLLTLDRGMQRVAGILNIPTLERI